MISREDAELRVIGILIPPMFPVELLPYTRRQTFGKGGIKVNFLVNYGWHWDLLNLYRARNKNQIQKYICSNDVSRIDLIIRLGRKEETQRFLTGAIHLL